MNGCKLKISRIDTGRLCQKGLLHMGSSFTRSWSLLFFSFTSLILLQVLTGAMNNLNSALFKLLKLNKKI